MRRKPMKTMAPFFLNIRNNQKFPFFLKGWKEDPLRTIQTGSYESKNSKSYRDLVKAFSKPNKKKKNFIWNICEIYCRIFLINLFRFLIQMFFVERITRFLIKLKFKDFWLTKRFTNPNFSPYRKFAFFSTLLKDPLSS